MTDSEKVKLVRKILEECLEFDGDKGTAMDDVLTVIAFGDKEKDGEEGGDDRC